MNPCTSPRKPVQPHPRRADKAAFRLLVRPSSPHRPMLHLTAIEAPTSETFELDRTRTPNIPWEGGRISNA